MNLDSFSLRAVVAEAAPLVEGAILQKVSQLTDWDLLLFLRQPGNTQRLLVRLQPGDARIHLVGGDMPPARDPGGFTMLLRKHLEGRRLEALRQPGLERAVHLQFSDWTLVAEIPGRVNNLFLLDGEGQVAGLLHADREAERRLRPGRPYSPPPRPDRPEALAVSGSDLGALLADSPDPAARALTRAVFGLPPQQARALCRRAGLDPEGPADPAALAPVWEAMVSRLRRGPFTPVVLPGGRVSPWPLGDPEERPCADMQEALEALSAPPGLEEGRAELLKILARARKKAETVLHRRQEDLHRAEEADALRQQGELLLAWQARIPPGAERAVLPSWEGDEVEIPLDPRLTAVENAQKLFREYRRRQRARKALVEPLERARREVEFVDDMILPAETAPSAQDLEELRTLWQEERAAPDPGRKRRRLQTPGAGPRRFRHEGFQILVGRNPRQNDRITLKVAAREDLWLHARGVPGAHVVIRTAGRAPGPETVHAAAVLAARFSRAAGSTSVEVLCTEVRRVRKPPGSPPGRVTVRDERTLTVRPDTRVEGLEEEGTNP